MAVTFKKGVYHLNEERNFDFQLNRIIMWDGGRIDDIEPISQKIHNSETWKTELIQLGELAENGFEVYLFEGPGQGGVMRLQGKHFTHEWEKPVKAILDYFHLEDVTIIGASLGGMLAPRAAAFEKRISRVIAWSVFPNFQEVILGGPTIEDKKQMKLAQFCIRFRLKALINMAIEKTAKKSEVVRWGLKHGMYAYEADTAYDYAVKMDRYQMIDIADKITQDVLIAGASKDHFIDYKTVSGEIDALTNVRSLTFRLFTEKEDACNH